MRDIEELMDKLSIVCNRWSYSARNNEHIITVYPHSHDYVFHSYHELSFYDCLIVAIEGERAKKA